MSNVRKNDTKNQVSCHTRVDFNGRITDGQEQKIGILMKLSDSDTVLSRFFTKTVHVKHGKDVVRNMERGFCFNIKRETWKDKSMKFAGEPTIIVSEFLPILDGKPTKNNCCILVCKQTHQLFDATDEKSVIEVNNAFCDRFAILGAPKNANPNQNQNPNTNAGDDVMDVDSDCTLVENNVVGLAIFEILKRAKIKTTQFCGITFLTEEKRGIKRRQYAFPFELSKKLFVISEINNSTK